MSVVSRRHALAVLAGLACSSASCSTWRVQSVAPEALLAAPSPPSRVRLRLEDSTHIVLEQPHLVGDAVAGTLKGAATTVPLHGITEVAVRRFSGGRTVGLAAAGVAGLVAVALVACATEGCGSGIGWEY